MSKKIFDPAAKVYANSDRVIEFLETGNTSPVLVEFDPSNACNHGCLFCISGYIHLPESKGLPTFSRDMLPRDKMLEICQDLIDMGVKAVNWTGGGEPTANPALGECIELLGKAGVKMGMFTNGTLLHRFPQLMHKLALYMTWVRFSVDAGTPDVYNSVRRTVKGKNCWDVMMDNLEGMLVCRKSYARQMEPWGNKPADIGVGFVITPDTYHTIVDFANEFKDVPVDYCQFKPEIVNREREGGVQREIEFWEREVEPLVEQARDILGDKFQMNGYKLSDLKDDPELLGRHYKKCLGSQLQPCIGADGEVYVCTNHRGYKEYSYGSVFEKSFKEIWNDIEKRRSVMHQIDDVEKFANCTQLCKPHESNKAMFNIYSEFVQIEDPGERALFKRKLEKRGSDELERLTHPEFI